MFGPHRRCVVVVGAQWGDEGKGKIVDMLSQDADVVIRYQGGANAGHTVVCGNEEFILHQIPSGILQPGSRCIIGNGVVLDPETLLAEMSDLERRGVQLDGRLAISDRAHLVLSYHQLLDRARERSQEIGTTGRGIGPAHEDKVGRRGIRVGELRNMDRVRESVTERTERANALLELLGCEERADPADQTDRLERLAPILVPLIADTGRMAFDALQAKEKILLEGAQGALLDVDHGTYPFVTSSNTTAGSAAVGAGIGPTAIDGVLGVVKAYTTRVGNGPLPTEASGERGEHLRLLGGEYGATTGRPRRCGWFDAVVARYAARINGFTDLAVTKLDVLDTTENIPICVGYRVRGERLEDFPADVEILEDVEPIYQEFPGWSHPTSDIRRWADLPARARAYLERIEALVDTPIAYVGVGTRRDQIITVR